MNKRLFHLILLMSALLSSCNDIAEDERLIYVKPASVSRCVLIEDFTGQACLNCPKATMEIEKLQGVYGADTVIAVGIYSGPFGNTVSGKKRPLTTDMGNEYFDNLVPNSAQPVGLVNRKGPFNYDKWGDYVHNELQKAAPVSIELKNAFSESDGKVDIEVKTLGREGKLSGKIQLWAVEDSITNYQLMPDGSQEKEYIHNHVFRASVNGLWGDDFSTAEGETKTFRYKFDVNEDWKPENMSVVAFIYNDDGVQNVTIKKIK